MWDYLFGTAYVPTEQAHLPLSFAGAEHYPTRLARSSWPFVHLAQQAMPSLGRGLPDGFASRATPPAPAE